MAKRKILHKGDLIGLFQSVDQGLQNKMEIILLGAASLIMLDIRERATWDIDLAAVGESLAFRELAGQFGFEVDVVSVTSTVDFSASEKKKVFTGKRLTAWSVNETDLIKLKLERFRRQDPDDIDAIIRKIGLGYAAYKGLALEAMKDYIGNPSILRLSILIVAENHYATTEVSELERELRRI